MEPLVLMVIFRARNGREDAVRQMLRSMVGPTRAEPGCDSYVLHESVEGDGTFAFYETWRTREDWDRHMQQGHLTALLAALPDLLAGDIQVEYLRVAA